MLLHSKKLLTFYCILYYYDIYVSLFRVAADCCWPSDLETCPLCAHRELAQVLVVRVSVIVVDNCGSLGKYNNLKRLNKIIQLFMLVKQTAENEATWPTKKTSGYPAPVKFMLYIPLYI